MLRVFMLITGICVFAKKIKKNGEKCELLTACAFGLEAGASCRLHGHRVDTTPAIPLTGNT